MIADFYRGRDCLGPGGEEQTGLALRLAGLDDSRPLTVADIGCGTGASTLRLAGLLDARITAVDFLPQFLEELQHKAQERGVADRVRTLACNMYKLPFQAGSMDLIWSEGAIYNLGFSRGVREWREYLKPGGVLAVTEVTWLTDQRPEPVSRFWEQSYPEIDTAASKLRVLEQAGYAPLGYFALPEYCWLENYYGPLEESFGLFLARHGHSPGAEAMVEEHRREIALYREYGQYYSYGFYIARRVD